MVELRLYDKGGGSEAGRPEAFAQFQEDLLRRLEAGETGVTDAVDAALVEAVRHGASDLHFEPWADCLSLRFRIDGLLHEVATIPKAYHPRILTRLKVLARIVVYQKDVPQDGRIDGPATPCGKGMRVSTFPTVYGEKAVVRILDTKPDLFHLDALGFREGVLGGLRAIASRPHGALLLTGPSSSGKTTTIYALLRHFMTSRESPPHIATIEDPVEYRLGRIAQTEINPALGFTFGAALRAVLRQDPEVIMVGEIRDAETAHIAIQAGLTGHLVISTIHSGTAAGVFTRLLDMGVEPFLIASSVTGVLAQRLVRVNCSDCTTLYEPQQALCARFGIADESRTFRKGMGCAQCHGIGYRGRTAIGELLMVNEEVTEGILSRARTAVLHEAACRNGMRTLEQDAVHRVMEGVTTLEEIVRVLPVGR